MRDVAISVIVAIYQAENYLTRCLDSILNQSFKDFEVLLIDDGSTDRSGEICDEYARKDDRIRVFHKPNEGRCLTRKKGVDEAIGEYSIHCDPDDWMEPDMLEVLYQKAKETGADIVLSDVWSEDENGSHYMKQCPSVLDVPTLINELYKPVMPSLWNKLIRRSCYTECQVKFDKDVEYAEDLFILLQLLKFPVSLAYEPRALYHYDRFLNPNNITQHIDLDTYIRSVNCFESISSKSIMVPINRVKCDVIWFVYRHFNTQFREYDGLYPEVNSFMLSFGVKHPVKHWNYWVMLLHRYRMGWIGTILEKMVKYYVCLFKKSTIEIGKD